MITVQGEPLTPEEEEALKAFQASAAEYRKQSAINERREAYTRDADPLFFGWQRGENTEQEWLDAVQAVKDANPYPEKPTA